jgi:glutaredoxin
MTPIQTPPPSDTSPGLIVYGADWCEDTRRTRRLLRRLGVLHRYRNVDEDLDALERATELNRGVRRTPVVTLKDDVLVEPTNLAMTNALVHHGVLTREVALERLHVQNVGDLERCVRVSAGLLLLALKRQAPSGLRSALGVTGTGLLLTGMAGWCPVFHTKSVSSLNGPGDRPDEAERARWLTSLRSARASSADEYGDDDDGADNISAMTAADVTHLDGADRDRAQVASSGSRAFGRGAGTGPGFESGSGGTSGRRGAPRLTLIEPDRPQ